MRAKPQSALQAPLNSILGTEANVRLLRVLAHAETPLAAGELAQRAELGRTSIYPALESLEDAGIVTFVGAGGQRQIALREAHPLSRVLVTLFRVEQQRVENLVAALRGIAKALRPHPIGVWAEGLANATTDTLSCWILGDPQTLPQLVDGFLQQLPPIEREFDVRVEVRGMTRSELSARATPENAAVHDDAVILAGAIPRPVASRREPRASGHGEQDARARRLGIALAAKLKRDPGLVRTARARIRQRTKSASPGEKRELLEWERILALSPARLQRFLVEPSEAATRLRQTLPALGVLTPAERDAVLRARSDGEARRALIGDRST